MRARGCVFLKEGLIERRREYVHVNKFACTYKILHMFYRERDRRGALSSNVFSLIFSRCVLWVMPSWLKEKIYVVELFFVGAKFLSARTPHPHPHLTVFQASGWVSGWFHKRVLFPSYQNQQAKSYGHYPPSSQSTPLFSSAQINCTPPRTEKEKKKPHFSPVALGFLLRINKKFLLIFFF